MISLLVGIVVANLDPAPLDSTPPPAPYSPLYPTSHAALTSSPFTPSSKPELPWGSHARDSTILLYRILFEVNIRLSACALLVMLGLSLLATLRSANSTHVRNLCILRVLWLLMMPSPNLLSLNARPISLTSLNPTQRSHPPRASHLWTIALLSLAVLDSTLAWLHLTLSCRCCVSIHDLTHFAQITFGPTICIQVLPDYIQLRVWPCLRFTSLDCLPVRRSSELSDLGYIQLWDFNIFTSCALAYVPNSRFSRSRCPNYRRARQDLDLDLEPSAEMPKLLLNASMLSLCYTSGGTAPMTVRCGQPQLEFNLDSTSNEPLAQFNARLRYQFGFLVRVLRPTQLNAWRCSAFRPESSGLNRFDVKPLQALRYLDETFVHSHLVKRGRQLDRNAKIQNVIFRFGGASRAQGVRSGLACASHQRAKQSRALARAHGDAARGSNICFDAGESDASSRGFAACGARCGSTWALVGRR
ncbi:hypothetical protein B0H13DRAFT_2286059 [Mycena leptocephala]|nr:hypothetical protein B0H13DRAFT_2286059 [Mycena leptocephala]